jgi:RNA polymerase sigma-70 factor (ECF subfamily)
MAPITDVEAVAAAQAGDETAFASLVQRHRRELHVHCYRMLGSFEEAEDLVQETFLNAWRARDTFSGGSGFRAWLYRIATNACLDAIRRKARRVPEMRSFAEVPWLQPYPDRMLDELVSAEGEPEADVVARETIELAFLAAIQLLPGRQRAVLLMREVLGMSAIETASLLEMSVAAVNSALQRARATMQEQPPANRVESTRASSEQERMLLQRYMDAMEQADASALTGAVRDDIRITMPPLPFCYNGIDEVAPLVVAACDQEQFGTWRLVPSRANRQPAAANYLRRPGETEFRAFKIDVLRVEGDRIAEITTFDSSLFEAFGLPLVLDRRRTEGGSSRIQFAP